MKIIRIPAITLAMLILSVPVSAHHGFGRFLMNKMVKFEGTLTGIDFVNPHSYVHFNVTGTDGAVTAMRCEMRAATVLRRSGWSVEMFKMGSRIIITGHPHREDPASCYVETLEIGNAPTLERYQQLSDHKGPAKRPHRPLRLASGEPNISGSWAQEQFLLAKGPDGKGLGRLVPKSMVADVESGKIALEDAPDPGWRPRPVTFTDAGRKASEALRNLPTDKNPRLSCQITSILFDWTFDGPINRITQNKDSITIEYSRGLKRVVHMGMERHPANIKPSRGGHSIGRWDGDTLVVDTVGFKPGILSGNVPNSAELHIVERFTLDTDKLALKREYTAEDPLYYTDKYTGMDTVLPADAPFKVDRCKELAHEYMTPEAKQAEAR